MLLYIDPGTGGMLFTIFFCLVGVVVYSVRSLKVKLKSVVWGKHRKSYADNDEKVGIVFFSDHKRYWGIFEPIIDELEHRGIDAKYLTMSEDDPGLERKYEHIESKFIGSGNRAFSVMNFIRACIVVSTTPSLDVFQWKRSKWVDYYIHILHAPNDPSMYRMFGLDFYDAVLLSGEYQIREIRELERLRNLPAKELLITGLPYLDVIKKKVDAASLYADKSDVTTVLVAPSWGPNSLLNRFGYNLIDALLETGYKIVLRPHPQSYTSESALIDKLRKKYADNPELEWNTDNDNFDILNRADIMISDFSGVIFEYALVFDKPIIYADTVFDNSAYDCCWIDEEPWTFSVLPKIGMRLDEYGISDLNNMISSCLNDPSYSTARMSARYEAWEFMGEGTVRTVDYLVNKLEEYCNVLHQS